MTEEQNLKELLFKEITMFVYVQMIQGHSKYSILDAVAKYYGADRNDIAKICRDYVRNKIWQ